MNIKIFLEFLRKQENPEKFWKLYKHLKPDRRVVARSSGWQCFGMCKSKWDTVALENPHNQFCTWAVLLWCHRLISK